MSRTRTPPTDTLRILIVDRDRTAADALAAGISALVPMRPEVVAVQSGRLGADAMRAGCFDIAALDVVSLTDLGGTAEDCIARLVKLAANALTVALSEGNSVSEALTAMRAGAHDVIAKPFDADAFTSRIEALAQRHGRSWALRQAKTQEAEMSAMLAGASAALRAAEAAPKRPPVLPMWQQEQRIIEDAIASFSGNITLAAQALELNPSTIYRKRQAWAEMENGTKGAA